MTGRLARFRRDTRGATIIEFAIVLPVMLLAIMGMMEVSYQIYVQSMLTGAVQKAGRDAGIQNGIGNVAAIDQQVLATVQTVASRAAFAAGYPKRTDYVSFRQISQTGPEPFVDTNKNGVRDPKECFDDINGNGVWDTQASTVQTGTGGATDVVVYSVQITYPRLFPLTAFIGGTWGSTATLGSTTVLRNQPFASQAFSESTICT